MKKIVMIFILFGIFIFSGCGSDVADDNLGVLDDDKPKITLYGETNIQINLGVNTILEDDRFVAEDRVDGDLSNSVIRTHNIDFTKAGEYQVTYFVEDSDGYSDTAIRTVTIVGGNYDSYNGGQQNIGSVPQITFSDGNNDTLYLTLGEQYNAFTYRATDFEDGDLTNAVRVEGADFDVNREGTYTVTYSVVDSNENFVEKIRTVIVRSFNLGNQVDYTTTSDIDSFKIWYRDVCGKSFNSSLYNATYGSYNGTISCSYQGLYTIDLTALSIFSTIKSLDLSHNNLTDIDFNQLDLSVNNVKILEDLDLSNNNFSYIDFTPLYNLKNINNLWIQGNSLDYSTEAKREALYRIFNNKSLTIFF